MGAPMARHLLQSLGPTDTLHVYDTYGPAIQSFSQSCPSAHVTNSSTECIKTAVTVITMLPNTSHVQSVFEPFLQSNEDPSALRGRLFVDSSTISPAATKLLSDALTRFGATLVDAPVSGGVVGAQAASLTFMISHPASIPLSRIESLLKTMGERIIVCGDYPGAGLAAKLANNYALALNNIAICDAMLLGQKLGLDARILANVINTSTGRCWPSEANNPVSGISKAAPAERDYEGGFGVGLMRKDLELALEAEKNADILVGKDGAKGSLSNMSTVALDLYRQVEASEKFGKKDFSAVYQYLKEKA